MKKNRRYNRKITIHTTTTTNTRLTMVSILRPIDGGLSYISIVSSSGYNEIAVDACIFL